MYTLAQITDCHLFEDSLKTFYGDINPYESLSQILEMVKEQAPDLVLVTGDISGDHSAVSYKHFATLWQQSGCEAELMVLPGNHDHPDRLREQFVGKELSTTPGISVDNWQIHGLDSHYRGTLGKVSEYALDQLELTIKYAPDMHHLVAVHHHPLATGGWMDKHEWLNSKDFVDRMIRYPQVKGVIYGHIHMGSDQLIEGCRFLSSPSTCWQWANSVDFAVSDEKPGFRLMKLASDGQFETTIFRI